MVQEIEPNKAELEVFKTYKEAYDYLYNKGRWQLCDTNAEAGGVAVALQSHKDDLSGYTSVTVNVLTPTSIETYHLDNRQNESLKRFTPLIKYTDWIGDTVIIKGQTISQLFIENPNDLCRKGSFEEAVERNKQKAVALAARVKAVYCTRDTITSLPSPEEL